MPWRARWHVFIHWCELIFAVSGLFCRCGSFCAHFYTKWSFNVASFIWNYLECYVKSQNFLTDDETHTHSGFCCFVLGWSGVLRFRAAVRQPYPGVFDRFAKWLLFIINTLIGIALRSSGRRLLLPDFCRRPGCLPLLWQNSCMPAVSQSLQLLGGGIRRIPAVTATAFPAHSPVDVTLCRGRS